MCAAQESLARLEDIVTLTEDHLSAETTAGSQELQDHFKAVQHLASMSCSHLCNQIEVISQDGVALFSEEEKEFKDVHTEHCCAKHGCKYGDGEYCTVESGKAPQSFPCETCDGRYNDDYDKVNKSFTETCI